MLDSSSTLGNQPCENGMSLYSRSENETTATPLYQYSPGDHSSIVVIMTVVPCLVMAASIAAKISLHRSIPTAHSFDFVLFAAASLLVIETSLTVWAAHLGLGRQQDDLDKDAVSRIRQVPNHPLIRTSKIKLLCRFTDTSPIPATIHLLSSRNSGRHGREVLAQPRHHRHQRHRLPLLRIKGAVSPHRHAIPELAVRGGLPVSASQTWGRRERRKVSPRRHHPYVHRRGGHAHGCSPVRAFDSDGLEAA